MFNQWAPYVPVAVRRRKAAAEMAKLKKRGQSVTPVVIAGRAIATTVWGKAWCANLESYSDYANRLPRGRTYVRNGSVVDLQIAPGAIAARVSGSSIYRVAITMKPLPPQAWKALCADSAGGIDSLVELLQGRFAAGVMQRLCRRGDGLFPVPKEIRFDCSCPDGASMCKHVAAVLYGVGARLDRQPELLFALRQVDAGDLLTRADASLLAAGGRPGSERILAADDVAAVFGLEMDAGQPAPAPPPAPVRAGRLKAKVLAKPRAASPVAAGERFRHLLGLLHKHGAIDNAAAREATGLDAAAVRALLRRLVADGLARVEGRKRGTRYLAI